MRFGLIGHPIEHSLSPALFKAGYDSRYPYELITGEQFEDSYLRFLNEFDGINVTAPFKELAFAKADIVSEECRLAKASNLLVKTSEGIKAYNSDFLGVRLWLNEVSGSVMGNKVLVVGCGGAGKAAAAAAVSTGMECILMNRSMGKAMEMAEEFKSEGYNVQVHPIETFCDSFREADIVIYTVPVALEQLEDLTDDHFTPGKGKCIMEANYRNSSFEGKLLRKMLEANPMAQFTDGRTWLLYQALTGYEIFTGERPDLAKMSDVL